MKENNTRKPHGLTELSTMRKKKRREEGGRSAIDSDLA